VELPSKSTVDKLENTPEFFEISSAADQVPVVEFEMTTDPVVEEKPAVESVIKISEQIVNKEASKTPSSGGYLAKPSQIYVEEQPEAESNSSEELLPLQKSVQEDEPVIEMQLVVKSQKAAE